jgi:hypothetical protein
MPSEPLRLFAADVRERLFAALDPVVSGLLTLTPREERDATFARLVIVLRYFPPTIAAYVSGVGDAADRQLTRGPLDILPNAEGIQRAMGDVLAGVLESLGAELAELAVAGVLDRAARFVLTAAPATGDVSLKEVGLGGEVIELGGIGSGPMTTH